VLVTVWEEPKMRKRNTIEKIDDGRKAYETRLAQWGPNEQKRAYEQAQWTLMHRRRVDYAPEKNPYLREKVYTREDFARVEKWKRWRKENPTKDLSQNPFSWANLYRSGDPAVV
jgi:hypothetical protein